MTLDDIIRELDLTVLTKKKDFGQMIPVSGYAADLLSCVLVGAERDSIWVTLQAHSNVVAVGSLLELVAIIIAEGVQPEPDVITKANEEGVTLLSTSMPTFETVGRLWSIGLK
ncbi:MAG: hypothetical protein JXA42_17670 [Anaerolineales bacterium]|nr:hypothetical protein [Anaerolineales bacterium]